MSLWLQRAAPLVFLELMYLTRVEESCTSQKRRHIPALSIASRCPIRRHPHSYNYYLNYYSATKTIQMCLFSKQAFTLGSTTGSCFVLKCTASSRSGRRDGHTGTSCTRYSITGERSQRYTQIPYCKCQNIKKNTIRFASASDFFFCSSFCRSILCSLGKLEVNYQFLYQKIK
jgi:hypothetical protein